MTLAFENYYGRMSFSHFLDIKIFTSITKLNNHRQNNCYSSVLLKEITLN